MLLRSREFEAAYTAIPVVSDASFAVAPGEIIALVGRNGVGKTTLLRGIMGLVPVCRGSLQLHGTEIVGKAPETIARLGVGYVPAGRSIFGTLSVRENLIMRAQNECQTQIKSHPIGVESQTTWTFERVLELFPRLGERLSHGGQKLSGGEQQMLAIGRALMTNPRLLMIDEATEGLAPLVARDIWKTLHEICKSGMATIIVDRDLCKLAEVASRAIILFKGQIVFDGNPSSLLSDKALIQRYVGL
jgi:branched-chain amino acid transport system ATP-binding protein